MKFERFNIIKHLIKHIKILNSNTLNNINISQRISKECVCVCVRVVIIIIRFLADCHYCKRCVYFLSFSYYVFYYYYLLLKININSKKNCHSKKVKLYFISTNSPSPYHQPTTFTFNHYFYALLSYYYSFKTILPLDNVHFYIYISQKYIFFSPLYYVLLFFFCIEKQKNNPNINSHHIKILFLLQCE